MEKGIVGALLPYVEYILNCAYLLKAPVQSIRDKCYTCDPSQPRPLQLAVGA
jgi:hypothetical protein